MPPGWWWQSLLHTEAGHCQVLHAAAPSSSLLPSWASPPLPRPGALLGFSLRSLCTYLGERDVFALAKQGGASSFPYDRLIGINKIEKSKQLTGMAGNKLF